MDGSDLATTTSAAAAAAGDRPPEAAAHQPERCEALAAAIAGVLGGALEEHEASAAATALSQGELAAAVVRLNGGGCLSLRAFAFSRDLPFLACPSGSPPNLGFWVFFFLWLVSNELRCFRCGVAAM